MQITTKNLEKKCTSSTPLSLRRSEFLNDLISARASPNSLSFSAHINEIKFMKNTQHFTENKEMHCIGIIFCDRK